MISFQAAELRRLIIWLFMICSFLVKNMLHLCRSAIKCFLLNIHSQSCSCVCVRGTGKTVTLLWSNFWINACNTSSALSESKRLRNMNVAAVISSPWAKFWRRMKPTFYHFIILAMKSWAVQNFFDVYCERSK